MHKIDVLVTGGTLVDSTHMYEGEIAIRNDKIVALGKDLRSQLGEELFGDAQIVDATGKLVTPGFIDAHTHMDLDVGIARACEDFFTGTRAALAGGTTAICDHMAFGPKGCTLTSRVDEYHTLADDKALCDYKFHGVVAQVNEEIVSEMDDLLAEGVNSAKIYMTYNDRVSDEGALQILRKAKELGMIVCVHAENHEMVETFKREYGEKGCLSPKYHPLSRPRQAEAEAVDRILRLASLAGDAPIYIVHLTTEDGLEVIKQARARGQKNIFAETCSQYLTFTDEVYSNDDGLKFTMSPPLRKMHDIQALWKGVAEGDIQVVATDHCPFTYGVQKQRGKDDFRMAPNGAPGVEERILAVARGVKEGFITWPKLVEVCAENPAHIFGLEPQKGRLQPGADADFCIIDPNKAHVFTIAEAHGDTDYTCYEGIEMPCTIEQVWLRGTCMVKDGKVREDKGYGTYLATGASPAVSK